MTCQSTSPRSAVPSSRYCKPTVVSHSKQIFVAVTLTTAGSKYRSSVGGGGSSPPTSTTRKNEKVVGKSTQCPIIVDVAVSGPKMTCQSRSPRFAVPSSRYCKPTVVSHSKQIFVAVTLTTAGSK